jgi:two-component system, OmpR family, sensor histidine kinase KdpD
MKRAELRIYLGYAAGVGKTFAMLGEGHRRLDRGTDVVAGFVETHDRPLTAEQLDGLEAVPRRRMDHRGSSFEEMDLDAVLIRNPQIVLVDELAHTNVPGSRNEKRWQDIDEILDAGISVISTVNVQHLESVNDVVERITGVHQRETVPDSVVRAADQIELVDMSPYSLRRRMAHGNIYPPEKIDAALSNYFREGNLGALRELSLLWLADRVDDSLQDYMRARGIEGPWETRERVLVAMSGRDDDDTLIRRAARMAVRRGGDLIAVHVIPEDGLSPSAALDSNRVLVASLGGSFQEVVGRAVPEALLDVARAENATQVVIGASSGSRWRHLVRGSVVAQVIRDSGPIDVHVISQARQEAHQPLRSGKPPTLPRTRRTGGAAIAAAGLVLLTALISISPASVGLSGILLLYLTLVVVVAAVGGWWPAITSAIVASFCINYFFTPPVHTLTISEAKNILALVVFVAVAVIVSWLVDRAERLRAAAQRGGAEAEALARLAGGLVSNPDPLEDLVDQLRTTFALDAVSVLRRDGDGWQIEAGAGADVPTTPESGSEEINLGEDAVLVLRGRRLAAEGRRVLTAFAAQLSFVVRSRMLQVEADEAAALIEVNELRSALLAAVSHDLRTPLASIKAAASSLRQQDVRWTEDDVAEFLATIEEETDRLGSLIANLLDMSRIQTNALALVRRRVGLDEVVPLALASLPNRGHGIDVDVAESLPRVDVDTGLLERAIANIIGNAVAWSPPEHPVKVLASSAGDRVELRVVDRGPGIAPADRERVFQPFQRMGDRSSGGVAGVGLGLAVAKGFVDAMGGSLAMEETPGGGLTVVVGFEGAA